MRVGVAMPVDGRHWEVHWPRDFRRNKANGCLSVVVIKGSPFGKLLASPRFNELSSLSSGDARRGEARRGGLTGERAGARQAPKEA